MLFFFTKKKGQQHDRGQTVERPIRIVERPIKIVERPIRIVENHFETIHLKGR